MPQPSFVAVDCNQLDWLERQNGVQGTPSLRYCTALQGGGGLPSVHVTEYEPHHVEPRHRHAEDEVLSIFEGEVEIDGQRHPAPSVLYVGRGTLYGPLKAGPQGCKFFRVAYNEAMLAEAAA
jgi:hypothetical protein